MTSTMKRATSLLAVLAAAILALAMTVPAWAATITIERDGSYAGGTGNETYTYYKILEASYADGDLGTVDQSTGALTTNGKAAYYVTTEAQKTALESTNIFTLTPSASGTQWNVVLTDENTSAADIVAALQTMLSNATYKAAFTTTGTVTSAGESTEIPNLDKGYYYIESSLGSGLAVQTLGDVTIKEKNTYPTIDKKQKDEDATAYGNGVVQVAVGDTIDYQVAVTVPSTVDKDITVVDAMTTGLTYTTGTVTIDGLTPGIDYAVSEETAQGFTITIHPTANTKGQTLNITFSATVNATAITTTDANKKNDVTLTYSHYTQTDSVSFQTKATSLFKYDGSDQKELEGVKFTLKEAGAEFKVTKHADGYYYYDANGSATVETDSNGLIIIRGLDGDKAYTLTETETLDGYNLLAGDQTANTVEDNANYAPSKGVNGTAVLKVANNKGTQLPSTGGIGTTIFYVIGGILIAVAAIFLITRKRVANARKEDEEI